jgi:hypothetical protein
MPITQGLSDEELVEDLNARSIDELQALLAEDGLTDHERDLVTQELDTRQTAQVGEYNLADEIDATFRDIAGEGSDDEDDDEDSEQAGFDAASFDLDTVAGQGADEDEGELVPESGGQAVRGEQAELDAALDKAADLLRALHDANQNSAARVAAMVASDASSSQKQIPFFAGEGTVLFGEGHPFDVITYLGRDQASGFVRFERNRLRANDFHFEKLTNAADQDLRDAVQTTLMSILGQDGVYPYPDRDRVNYRWK